jgi:Kef-type K+ transport system membrane component KefB
LRAWAGGHIALGGRRRSAFVPPFGPALRPGVFRGGSADAPFGLNFFSDAETLRHIAELGVVMFLFILGLEMRAQKI